MASGPLGTVLRHLRRMTGGPDTGDPPDRQLLERFAAGRDEDAFALLVKRHGPLVWRVCWRTLRHAQDAEDCFQATFLVLARKAGSVCWHDCVANWLYEVAARIAAEAKTRRARRQARERPVNPLPEERPVREAAAQELCAALDEELLSLPAKYRSPLLECYLQGHTADEAARRLGWSLRTLQRRLAQGRELLRDRLSRRGFTLSGVLLGVVLFEGTGHPAVPPALAVATAKTATSLGSGAPPTVILLAEAAAKGMTMRLKYATFVVLLLSATVGAGGLFVRAALPPAGPVPAEKKEGTKTRETPHVADDLAGRLWAILELVEKNHVKPPARAEMILAGAKALLRAGNADPVEGLARRASAVADEDQLRALLRDIWPKQGEVQGASARRLESALFDGLFDSIPGRPALWSAAAVTRMDRLGGNRYVGIGVQLAANEREKRPQITIPFRRGAARRAGTQPGDLLLEIDGKSTQGMLDLEKVAALLQGEEGTSLTLVVRQPGAAETRTLRLTRGVIPFDSVLGFRRTSEDGWDYVVDREARIGYVWVKSLSSSTPHELQRIERHLRADGVRALVLDFRFSTGEGNLHHAALVADGLLDGGLMWTTTGKSEKAYRADRECLFRGWPLAVLVNDIGDNAQGAALAALQDNKRAILVGAPTKVDGSIRQLFPLPNQQGAITVLIGRLRRADPVRDWPVRPDHTVELTKDQRAAVQKWLLDKQLPELPAGTDDRPPNDPQLARALADLGDALKAADRPQKRESGGRK